MSGSCNGKCINFPEAHVNGGKTCKDGLVRCKTCTMFFRYEGIFCQCCGNRVSRRCSKIKVRM